MYKLEDLKKYDYFNDVNIDYALDSLTGVLSRAKILGFARYLVDNNIKFMMGILDIDNFKLVNDNYGHKVGDGCLNQLATGLANYVGDEGLVGRFGGDEFIVIWFNGTTYEEMHRYIERMYNEGNIVRRKMTVDKVSFYVTATIGCASFPKDANTYDEKTKLTERLSLLKLRFMNGEVFSKDTVKSLFDITPTCVWNRLYKAQFIRQHNLKFQEISSSNDTGFAILSLLFADRITYVNQPFILYRINQAKNTTETRDIFNCLRVL